LRKHDEEKVLWVEDATSLSRDNEAWCSFFMEPTVEKMNKGSFGIYTEKPFMCFVERKIIRVFSCQVIRNGNQITIQTTGLKYIDHMVGM
jgi:hypothetical protein